MIMSKRRPTSNPAAALQGKPPRPESSRQDGSPTARNSPTASGHQRLIQVVLAVAIVGGPLGYVIGGALIPSINGSGQSVIAANVAANSITNAVHIVAYVLASYLLPIGAVGLARLAYPHSPWLATVGGLLAVVGWLPFSALTALDDLAHAMAHQPGSDSYAELFDRFSTDAVMFTYLMVYIVGHLVAYVLLGAALRRARLIPRWAAWSMIGSSPLTIIAFALPASPRVIGTVALTLLLLGSLPAARRTLHS